MTTRRQKLEILPSVRSRIASRTSSTKTSTNRILPFCGGDLVVLMSAAQLH
jgi:hypothetical protein